MFLICVWEMTFSNTNSGWVLPQNWVIIESLCSVCFHRCRRGSEREIKENSGVAKVMLVPNFICFVSLWSHLNKSYGFSSNMQILAFPLPFLKTRVKTCSCTFLVVNVESYMFCRILTVPFAWELYLNNMDYLHKVFENLIFPSGCQAKK